MYFEGIVRSLHVIVVIIIQTVSGWGMTTARSKGMPNQTCKVDIDKKHVDRGWSSSISGPTTPQGWNADPQLL